MLNKLLTLLRAHDKLGCVRAVHRSWRGGQLRVPLGTALEATLAWLCAAQDAAPDGGAIQLVVDEATFVLPLAGVIDLDAERARITKGIEAASKEAASLAGRLNNPAFVEKAKPEAVDKARADHAEKSAEVERLQAALARLG